MSDRVLIGKGSSARGSSTYGLWVSKSGQSVLTDGDDDLSFNSALADTSTGVTSKNGEAFGVKYYGSKDVTTNSYYQVAETTIVTWPSSLFTFDGVVHPPMFVVQAGITSGTASTQSASGTMYVSSVPSRNRGGYCWCFPSKRNSSTGAYDASGTHGAIRALLYFPSANTTYKVYYWVGYPYIDV